VKFFMEIVTSYRLYENIFIYLFAIYLTTLSVTQTVWRRTIWIILSWKEVQSTIPAFAWTD
jgi:hypothetical protein